MIGNKSIRKKSNPPPPRIINKKQNNGLMSTIFEGMTFGLGSSNVWSHGSIFDIVIVENICRHFQQAVTWKFWEVRDTRTLFDLANIEVKIQGKHNALTDAIAQSKAVQTAYKKLSI